MTVFLATFGTALTAWALTSTHSGLQTLLWIPGALAISAAILLHDRRRIRARRHAAARKGYLR